MGLVPESLIVSRAFPLSTIKVPRHGQVSPTSGKPFDTRDLTYEPEGYSRGLTKITTFKITGNDKDGYLKRTTDVPGIASVEKPKNTPQG